jgi:hypothetical protein
MRQRALLLLVLAALLSFECRASEQALNPQIKAIADQQSCNVTHCGELVEVSCRPELDGSLTYFNNSSGAVVMKCGGACDSPAARSADPLACKSCPPREWVACTKK